MPPVYGQVEPIWWTPGDLLTHGRRGRRLQDPPRNLAVRRPHRPEIVGAQPLEPGHARPPAHAPTRIAPRPLWKRCPGDGKTAFLARGIPKITFHPCGVLEAVLHFRGRPGHS